MNIWDKYKSRLDITGSDIKDSSFKREVMMLNRKTKENLSFNTVLIDGVKTKATVINSDNLNEKFIISLPGKDIKNGGLVEWMDNHWLITERDANTTLYTKCKMIQCNHLLKWVTEDGKLHEQWCIIDDGTKYMSGEFEDRDFVVTRGDSRIAMTIGKNELTSKFNRESRFLIDDVDSPHKLSYLLTKPLKLPGIYNDEGVYKFVLQEVTATADDNHILGIANYYKYFPKEADSNSTEDTNPSEQPSNDGSENSGENTGKKVWL